MLSHEKDFFDTLKSKQAQEAFKAMIQDCNDAIRALNSERLKISETHLIVSMTLETEKMRARLRADAMYDAIRIDTEMMRTIAGVGISTAYFNRDS